MIVSIETILLVSPVPYSVHWDHPTGQSYTIVSIETILLVSPVPYSVHWDHPTCQSYTKVSIETLLTIFFYIQDEVFFSSAEDPSLPSNSTFTCLNVCNLTITAERFVRDLFITFQYFSHI